MQINRSCQWPELSTVLSRSKLTPFNDWKVDVYNLAVNIKDLVQVLHGDILSQASYSDHRRQRFARRPR